MGRLEKIVLRWLGHLERIGDERVGRMVYDPGFEGRRGRERSATL